MFTFCWTKKRNSIFFFPLHTKMVYFGSSSNLLELVSCFFLLSRWILGTPISEASALPLVLRHGGAVKRRATLSFQSGRGNLSSLLYLFKYLWKKMGSSGKLECLKPRLDFLKEVKYLRGSEGSNWLVPDVFPLTAGVRGFWSAKVFFFLIILGVRTLKFLSEQYSAF